MLYNQWPSNYKFGNWKHQIAYTQAFSINCLFPLVNTSKSGRKVVSWFPTTQVTFEPLLVCSNYAIVLLSPSSLCAPWVGTDLYNQWPHTVPYVLLG